MKEMEEDMMEDTENEEMEYSFTVYEIDLEYEFDAARFFDFSREESPLEARQAELWFESAGSYPPSPFVEIPIENILLEKINISPKCKGVEAMNLSRSDLDVEAVREISPMELNYRGEQRDKGTSSSHLGSQQKFQNQSQKLPLGLAFYNPMVNAGNPEDQSKISQKPAIPRSSTLMKPTASQLAKQNHPFQASHSRSCMAALDKTSKTVSTCVVENQAPKRQKLECGLLRKVMCTAQLQQTNFVHKPSKRDGLLDGNMTHTKPRITIPRDPNLETANRAQRIREKSSNDENMTSKFRRFKALPLNRKTLEAPSLLLKRSTPRLPDFHEFHLKTSERALQHSSVILKSTPPLHHSNKDLNKFATNLTTDYGSREPGRPSLICNNASNQHGFQSSHNFKALPLNKKILSSKGDIGILRNWKKESTVPKEFNFQTEKRFRNNPPIELFNKLSLVCESQTESKAPWSISTPAKGSKENRWGCFQQGNEIKQLTKPKLPLIRAMQKLNTNEEKVEVRFASWSEPIR